MRSTAWLGLLMAVLLSVSGRAQSIQPDSPQMVEFAAERSQYASRAGATVAVLASDSLAGRGYGPADGARRAARYLAGRFRALGLEPLGDSAGRSYYQHFTLPINTFTRSPTLVLTGHALFGAWMTSEGYPLAPFAWRNRYPRPGYEFIAEPNCPSVHLTRRIVELDTSWFSLDSGTVTKLVRARSLRKRVLVLRAADEKRLAKLPIAARRWVASAAAVLVREPRKLTASLAGRQGAQPWLRILDSAWTAGFAPRRAVLIVQTQLNLQQPAVNVIGRSRGTHPSDSVMIVSAHYDHLGQQGPASTFYGANDNASGVAMLLELVSDLKARHPPRHDVLFIAFGAEEAGLIGSQWCAAHPPVPLRSVRFLLNLDLEGFGDKGATVVNATLHARRFHLLDSLRRAAPISPLPALNQRGRAANSDHYPFSERGVPAFFVYSLGGPGFYHDVRDRPATLRLADAYPLFHLLRAFLGALDGQP